MLAVLFMLLDHIYLYFAASYEIPAILTWIGRASYPLFLFCMVWGYHYTKNRKVYLIRLYLMSLFMTALIYALDTYVPTEIGFGNHNIFLPMLWVGILISVIETFQKNRKKGSILLVAIFVLQLLYWILPGVIPFLHTLNGDMLTGIIPNIYQNEYGFEFVALGVLMYFLKEKKDFFCAMYVVFCIAQFSMGLEYGGGSQWLMILALPLMMRYNNKKGPGLKYFFYVFYPAHTALLFYLVNFVFKKA